MAPTCYCTSRWAMVPKKFIYITHQIKRNYKNRNGKRHKHSSKRCSKSHISPKTTKWSYQESWAKTLFGLADNDNQFAKQENTFNIASDWLVLSADQAKKLGEYMEQHAADIKKEGTETVGKKMMAAMMANPSMSRRTSETHRTIYQRVSTRIDSENS